MAEERKPALVVHIVDDDASIRDSLALLLGLAGFATRLYPDAESFLGVFDDRAAGCVVAERLSASGRFSVLVLEAGGTDRRFYVQMPLGYGKTFFDPAVNWNYRAEPDPGLAGNADHWPRGKLLGGSSSINAMVWIRGHPADYDGWAAQGNPGWSFADLLPIFIALGVKAKGQTMFWNKVYEGGLTWHTELSLFGAHTLLCDPHRLITFGGNRLVPATVTSPYIIRVAIALLMVAASIEGESTILDADPIRRAHPNFVPNIDSLGVNVEWEK